MLSTYICEVGVDIQRDEALSNYRVKITPRFKVEQTIYGYLEGERSDVLRYLEQTQAPISLLPDPRNM